MKKRHIKCVILKNSVLVLFLLFLCLVTRSFAASSKIRFERFGIQDGLSDNTITSTCRDSKGFMWFGTRNGLNRFDGSTYIHFKHDPNDSTTISDNFIQDIFEDSGGVLWIGTLNGGLNRYDREMGTFTHFLNDPRKPESISGNTVSSIAEGRDGILWVGTTFGLNAFDRRTGGFKHYFSDPVDSLTINNNNVGCVFPDKKGDIWIGTNVGLNKIDYGTTIVRRLPDRNKVTSKLNQNIINILEDNNGTLWISTWGGGLRKFDPKTETFEVFLHNPDDPASISSNIVGHMAFDSSGILWFGTTQGLDSIDPASNMIVHHHHDPSDPFSMSSDSIWGVYYDRSEILWIGTLYGGGNKIVPSKLIFNYYNYDDIYKGPYKINNFYNFCEIKSSIWFESTDGLHRLDPEKNTFNSYIFKQGIVAGKNIDILYTIFNDNAKELWLGTSIPGLVRYDIEKNVFTSFTPYTLYPDLQHFSVAAIRKDPEGMLWLGTSMGILKFDPQTETFSKTEIDDKVNQTFIGITDIIFDSDKNNVWIFGSFGVYQLDRNNKKVTCIFSNEPGSPSLRSNYIYSALDDGHGLFWLGTNDGLYSYDKKAGTYKRYTLFNDTIHSLIQDKQGNIWAGTDGGLSCIELSTKEVYNYDAGDGLPFIDNIDHALYCGNDNRLYVGGRKGFYTFHMDSLQVSSVPPPVVITSLKIGNIEVALKKKITEISALDIPYRKAPLTLEFSALDYVNPSKNRYAYKMEGLEKEWNQSGNQRTVTYTNLEPGSYVFRVKAANSQGLWNNQGVSLVITIIPPFWKTAWFRFCALMFFFGLLFSGYMLRVRNMQRMNRELETRVEERTEELKKVNEELLNEIHEREEAESKIKVLRGLLPICASCKKIRDDKGYWTQIELYIRDHSEADFSHGICPECKEKLYGDLLGKKRNQGGAQ